MSDYDRVQELALALPEVEASTSWGTASCKVRGKMFLRHHEDPELIVLRVPFEEREALTAERPETFIVTPHYQAYPYMLVRTGDLSRDELRELLTDAWRMCAPKRLVKQFDAQQ